MTYETKDYSGALFKNDKQGGNPNWPDYKGSIKVAGVEYWLSAWIKKSKNAKTYMSLAVKLKQARAAPAGEGAQEQTDTSGGFEDSSIPF